MDKICYVKKYKILIIILLVLMVASSGCNSNTTSSNVAPIIFCEDINENLEPIGTSETFSVGEMYAYFQSPSPFNTSQLKITVYKLEGAVETIYDYAQEQVSQDWNTLALPIYIDTAGDYKVVITNPSDDQIIGEGEVTVN